MIDRPRVLRLITRLNIGGPARQALLLTKALADDYPTLLAAGKAPPEEGELLDPQVDVTEVDLKRSLQPVHDLRAYRQVKSHLGGRALLHTHMAKAGTIGRLAAFRSRPRPRTVHTFHGHVLEGYFRPAVQRGFIAVERYLARRTDVLVAVSEEVRDSLLELGIGDEKRFRVIRLGFDLSAFLSLDGPDGRLRHRLGLGDDVPLVGVVGRLARIKDHAALLHAIARVEDVHLVVFGDGELRAELQVLASSLDVAARTHFYGWCLDVPSCIRDVDVMALSSRNEGTPVSLIEAAAAGIPAVATDVGGVRTVVEDGETGLLVPPSDPDALATAMVSLLADESKRRVMGTNAREHVRKRFDADRLIADIRGLYRELLGR